jgi:hypothetical protein
MLKHCTKFRATAERAVTSQQADRIVDLVSELAKSHDITELMEALR